MLVDAIKEEISQLRLISSLVSAIMVATFSWLINNGEKLLIYKITMGVTFIAVLLLIVTIIDREISGKISNIKVSRK